MATARQALREQCAEQGAKQPACLRARAGDLLTNTMSIDAQTPEELMKQSPFHYVEREGECLVLEGNLVILARCPSEYQASQIALDLFLVDKQKELLGECHDLLQSWQDNDGKVKWNVALLGFIIGFVACFILSRL